MSGGKAPNRRRLWGPGGSAPSRHEFLGLLQKHSYLAHRSFLSKKDSRVPPRGLDPPLLALLVDLRYSIGIFVCRLVATKNISGGQLLPGYAPGYSLKPC